MPLPARVGKGKGVPTIFRRAGYLGFAAIALLLVSAGLFSYRSVVLSGALRQSVNRSYRRIDAIHALQVGLLDAEAGQRAYLLTGQDVDAARYSDAAQRVRQLLPALQGASDPARQAAANRMAALVGAKLDELSAAEALRQAGDTAAALREIESGRNQAVTAEIRQQLETTAGMERAELDRRLAEAETDGRMTAAAAIAVVGLSLLALAWAAVLLRHGLQRERRAQQAAASQAQLLDTTIESLSQGIAAFDRAQLLVAWNRRFATLLELPAEMLQPGLPYGRIVEQLAAGDAAPFLETAAEIAAAAFAEPRELVVKDRERDGRSFELRRSRLPDGGFVLSLSDRSEQARLEAAVRRAQRIEAVGQLAGGLAHDFNNLLQIIFGNLDFVGRNLPADDPLAPRIAAALRGAERGAATIRQLLAFARRQPLAPVALDLNRLVGDMTSMLNRSLGASIELAAIPAPDLWPAVADPAQLENVIVNLVLNARDAMPKGGKITIETANAAFDEAYAREHADVRAGPYVMLGVTDTGTGMTEEVAARAFEPFFTTKPEGVGTGLGLSQVYGFIKQSRGHVTLASTPGAGTTVRIYLPRSLDPPAEAVVLREALARPVEAR
jgi:signal transduction histidine kinase